VKFKGGTEGHWKRKKSFFFFFFFFFLQNGADDFITYATLLEIHLEKVEFFSIEAQSAVLDGLLDIFLPVSEQKV